MEDEHQLSKELQWDKIHLFWVDQHCDSQLPCKGGMDMPSLIAELGIPQDNVHQICTGNCNCGYLASIYEQTIYNVVGGSKNRTPPCEWDRSEKKCYEKKREREEESKQPEQQKKECFAKTGKRYCIYTALG